MNKCIIIAEAGVNHNGNLDFAKQLVQEAKYAGADIIKFQTFQTEELVSKTAPKAEYQIRNTKETASQYDMLKNLELSQEDHLELISYCNELGISFLSTAFDLKSIDLLHSLKMPIWKIPSGELTNLPYLEKIARFNQPIILSTGMATLEEVASAITLLKQFTTNTITLLHCTTEYPAPYHSIHLHAMETLRTQFDLPVGYSDHSEGLEVSIAAVALGATVIEKHFTLDKTLPGPDHKASLEPHELKQLISSIRNIEAAMGSYEKSPTCEEQKNRLVARKSITAKQEIKQGELFTVDNLTTKRPGTGISPMKWYEYIGKPAKNNYRKDELIKE